jgi:hypothetical protein
MEKKGIVKYVSTKTFGIQLEGESGWYNATMKAKDDVIPQLRGREVVLEVEGKVFSAIKVLESSQPTKMTRSELLIARQVAIKAAAELATENGITLPDTLKVAEAIEKWILR